MPAPAPVRWLGRWLPSSGDALASVFLAGGCRMCDQFLAGASRVPICDHCLASFEPVPRQICDACGLPLPDFRAPGDERIREKERGYNQADRLARLLAKKLKLPCRPMLLVRIRPRPDKRLLTLDERWASVRGAFAK